MNLNFDKVLEGLRCARVLLDDANEELKTLNAILKAKMTYEGVDDVSHNENEKNEHLWRALLCTVKDLEFFCSCSKKEVDTLLNRIEEENENE